MIARLKILAAGIGLVIAALLASWFGGRKSAQADAKTKQVERNLATALRAEEIEDEVEALDTDALKRRARVWVRKSN